MVVLNQFLLLQGGVGLRLRIYDRIMCFVNCHLAAHLEAVNRRNADFDHIYRNMVFSRSSNLLNNAAGMVKSLLLALSLAFLTYLFCLLSSSSSALPFLFTVAAGVTTAVQNIRGSNVGTFFFIPYFTIITLGCVWYIGTINENKKNDGPSLIARDSNFFCKINSHL